MSEGARKGSKFIVVCTSPDVCLTPLGPTMVPVPYQIVAHLDESCMTADHVTFGGEPAILVDQSMVMKVTGDEAGIGGGIKSGHNRWIVEFDEGSDTVHVNGKRVVRHGDRCWMNGRNTRGMVICTDGMGPACSIVNGKPAADTHPPRASSVPAGQAPPEVRAAGAVDSKCDDEGGAHDLTRNVDRRGDTSGSQKHTQRSHLKAGSTGVTIRGRGTSLKPARFVPQAAALREAAQLAAPYCYV